MVRMQPASPESHEWRITTFRVVNIRCSRGAISEFLYSVGLLPERGELTISTPPASQNEPSSSLSPLPTVPTAGEGEGELQDEQEISASTWDPDAHWTVEDVCLNLELKARAPMRTTIEAIAELPKQSLRYRGKRISEILDDVAGEADLFQVVKVGSPDTCGRLLAKWKEWRAKRHRAD
jgi:hypothetical protein